MVRGNWQKRVETAEARRKEAKQRKQRNESKKQYKVWVQDLFRLLDGKASPSVVAVHLWTDAVPLDGPALLPPPTDHHKTGRGRSNSGSSEHTTNHNTNNNNNTTKSSKKKAHPRSKGANDDDDESSGNHKHDVPQMYRPYFFAGKTEDHRKNSGRTRYVQYPPHYQTLRQVLWRTKRPMNLQELIAAEACVESLADNNSNSSNNNTNNNNSGDNLGMDMLYYRMIHLAATTTSSNDNTADPPTTLPSEQISSVLSDQKVALSSIVYLVVDDILVYDRHREGLLWADDDALAQALMGERRRHRSSTVSSSGGNAEPTADAPAQFDFLPGTVLEHMLTFLPDSAVASCSQVCRTWHREIGQNSPALWRHLLQRRQWPAMQDIYCKQAFLRHYTALRNARAVRQGLASLDTGKAAAVAKEMAYHDFASRKHAPVEPDFCTSLHAWSEHHILAAYSHDCTLRLFASRGSDSSHEMIACKELVCQTVDPYKNTKRRKCRLLSTGLDEECIGSLCLVSTDKLNVQAYILVVVNRDEFLLGESSFSTENVGGNVDHLNVIDIGEAVLNYILSHGTEADHPEVIELCFRLVEFIEGGGEIGQVEVAVSPSFAACGYGRFLLDVSLSVPRDDDELVQLGRKLVLVSAGAGAIIWVGPAPHTVDGSFLEGRQPVHMAVRRESRTVCKVSVTPSGVPGEIVTVYLQTSSLGDVTWTSACHPGRTEALLQQQDVWQAGLPFRRLVPTTSGTTVVVDNVTASEGEVERPGQVIFTFLAPADEEPSVWVLEGMLALQTICLSDEYLLVLCRENKGVLETAHAVDGQWFLVDENTPAQDHTWAVVLHIPSRTEIGRQLWLKNPLRYHYGQSHIVVSSPEASHTLGVALSWKGVVMTGSAVRAQLPDTRVVALPDTPSSRSAKKKRKKKPAKNAKKDGFARGMSLRG